MQPADREIVKEVTVPANTKRTAPAETDVSFAPGRVVALEVVIPPGVAGLGGFQLTNSGQQALPYNAGAFFVGDAETIHRDIVGYNNSGRWGFRAYNEDSNAHTYQIRFEIVENDVPAETPFPTPPVATTSTGQVETTPKEGTPSEGSETPLPAPEGAELPNEPPIQGEPPGLPGELPQGEKEPEGVEPPTEGSPSPPPSLGEFGTGEGPEGEAAPPGVSAPVVEGEEPEGESEGAPEVIGQKPQPSSPGSTRQPGTRVVTSVKLVTLPAGGWLPAGARFTRERTDQGQDLITEWRGPITAPGDGYVVHNLSDRAFPVGFGPRYAVVHITTGPFAGHDWYVGHCTSVVNDGEHFKAGRVLAHADQGNREGGGWAEIGEAPSGYPGPMGNGNRFAHLFTNVTRREVVKTAPRPVTHKPAPKRKPSTHRPTTHKPTRKAPAPRVTGPAPKRTLPASGPHSRSTPPAGHSGVSGAPRPAAPPRRAPASPKRAPSRPASPPRPAPRPPAPRSAPRPTAPAPSAPRRTPAPPPPPPPARRPASPPPAPKRHR